MIEIVIKADGKQIGRLVGNDDKPNDLLWELYRLRGTPRNGAGHPETASQQTIGAISIRLLYASKINKIKRIDSPEGETIYRDLWEKYEAENKKPSGARN